MAITLSIRNFIGLIAYPPGSIYCNTEDVDPAEIWGGEWEKLKGTFLWAADEERPLGSTGGEDTHTLDVSEMPKHSHLGYVGTADSGSSNAARMGYNNYAYRQYTESAGEDQPHNNMPPYTAVNMWKRLAAFPSGGGYLLDRLRIFFKGGVCYACN